jgi:site-specific recombinase XerD
LHFNRTVVVQYRTFLEKKHLAAATINVRLAAVRRLAYEAADSGILSPDVVAGIRRVKGVRQIGQRVGNWLSLRQGENLLGAVSPKALRGKRDAAMLSVLMGCGLRRSEVVGLDCERIQQREGHWDTQVELRPCGTTVAKSPFRQSTATRCNHECKGLFAPGIGSRFGSALSPATE